jgi:hypothetical protein
MEASRRQQLDRFGPVGIHISTVRGAGYRLDEIPERRG